MEPIEGLVLADQLHDAIDKKYIQQFMYETLDTPRSLQRDIQVNHFQSSQSSAWQITGKRSIDNRDIPAYTTYGTGRANAYEILEDVARHQKPLVGPANPRYAFNFRL